MARRSWLSWMFQILVMVTIAGRACADQLTWKGYAQAVGKVKTVLLNNGDPANIFIGTDKGIWQSQDSGKNWRVKLKLPGIDTITHLLLSEPGNSSTIYAATDCGLYVSYDRGQRWTRLFKGKNAPEGAATGLAVAGDSIYLGTKNGLFISRDRGRSWRRESGKLGNSLVVSITRISLSDREIFVACRDGVYKTIDAGGRWEKVFFRLVAAEPIKESEEAEDAQEKESPSGISYLLAHPYLANCIYAATSKGVYLSSDKGATWDKAPSSGLLCQSVIFLSVSTQGKLYALTKSGLFCLRQGQWTEAGRDITAMAFNYLTFDKTGALYCATDSGLFVSKPDTLVFESNSEIISFYCKGEPSIKEVQSAAAEYAEVNPEKIKKWRVQASRRALLPSLSFGMDTSSTDLWHWETGSTTKSEDDCLRKGRTAIDWAVTLSWNLGDLVWNNDQTSIDVRSRLTTQLRQDILDEVTKVYFERIRKKIELNNLAIEDRKKRLENELGIQELTAQLDAMTGGYFSSHLKP